MEERGIDDTIINREIIEAEPVNRDILPGNSQEYTNGSLENPRPSHSPPLLSTAEIWYRVLFGSQVDLLPPTVMTSLLIDSHKQQLVAGNVQKMATPQENIESLRRLTSQGCQVVDEQIPQDGSGQSQWVASEIIRRLSFMLQLGLKPHEALGDRNMDASLRLTPIRLFGSTWVGPQALSSVFITNNSIAVTFRPSDVIKIIKEFKSITTPRVKQDSLCPFVIAANRNGSADWYLYSNCEFALSTAGKPVMRTTSEMVESLPPTGSEITLLVAGKQLLEYVGLFRFHRRQQKKRGGEEVFGYGGWSEPAHSDGNDNWTDEDEDMPSHTISSHSHSPELDESN